MTNKLANFRLRLLASLNDSVLLFLPHTLYWLYLSQSRNLDEFVLRFVIYLVLIILPLLVAGFLYSTLLTTYFGATLGKFLTGLRVTSEEGEKLSFRRSFFRHTIGYQFSWLLFGLGYLSIIKDAKKQAWHDKSVGSKVVVSQTLWPLGLVSLVLLLTLNYFLVTTVIGNFSQGGLLQEIMQTIEEAPLESLPTFQTSNF